MKHTRKKFLAQLGTGFLTAALPSIAFGVNCIENIIDTNDFTGEGQPEDECYWKRIARKYYRLAEGHINLENGFYGIQPLPVLQALQKNMVTANEQAA